LKHIYVSISAVLILAILLAAGPAPPTRPQRSESSDTVRSPLPLPRTLPSPEYQRLLYRFLDDRTYQKLGWAEDKKVRDTGPFINGKSYGTHNAVRIYYSPEVIDWLDGGRKGSIPDGSVIIKEMFDPPAARYDSTAPAALDSMVTAWAVMVRDSAGSKDGWYWSFYAPGQKVDDPARYPYDYPNSDFGIYCVRCHASAEKEFTFSSPRNIAGKPGEPLTFRVDDSWLPDTVASEVVTGLTHKTLAGEILATTEPHVDQNREFLELFRSVRPAAHIQTIPPLTYDHVIVGPGGPTQFVTSDQCLSCHDGQPPNLGPNMYFPGGGSKNVNLSPYGEWNWSMMGLAGRDPIFYAQLESEITLQPSHADSIQNICFSCHGVMGKRQLAIDEPGMLFNKEMTQVTDRSNPLWRYGALARDGVSCTVCHQIVDDRLPLDSIVTGQFHVSHPGEFEPGVSYIYGPFSSPSVRAMDSSLGMKPVQSDYIKSSRLCGSCHTVYLPVYDSKGKQVGNFYEQATYLEWLNSAYQNELGAGGTTPKTCQNCHMPTRYPDEEKRPTLAFRVANIQDQTYPEADERAPISEITVPIRSEFARHTLLGINQFGLEMFNQFDSILGVRKTDYMTGSSNGLPFAIAVSDTQAKRKTVDVELLGVRRNGGTLQAQVKVTNKTGHRFPSGVGFRRAFLELQVIDPSGRVVWASGRTNGAGVILGPDGKPLPTEFYAVDPATGKQSYQPHYQKITRQDQVQIFQELILNPQDSLTTSFLALKTVVKDNRLLPIGWTPKGPPGFKYAEETMPHGNVLQDKEFMNGTGSDIVTYDIDLPSGVSGGTVVATMYYQAIPPAYLKDRFTTAPDGKGTQRLFYLASRLKVKGTNIEDWKLKLSSAEKSF
jgi:hypothetical protein